jgi:hypothetical protein
MSLNELRTDSKTECWYQDLLWCVFFCSLKNQCMATKNRTSRTLLLLESFWREYHWHWIIVTVGRIYKTKFTPNAVDLTYCIVNECSPLLLYSLTLLASQQDLQIPTCFYRISLFEETFINFPKLLPARNDFAQSNGCCFGSLMSYSHYK